VDFIVEVLGVGEDESVLHLLHQSETDEVVVPQMVVRDLKIGGREARTMKNPLKRSERRSWTFSKCEEELG
jgi:hypothetical protein